MHSQFRAARFRTKFHSLALCTRLDIYSHLEKDSLAYILFEVGHELVKQHCQISL